MVNKIKSLIIKINESNIIINNIYKYYLHIRITKYLRRLLSTRVIKGCSKLEKNVFFFMEPEHDNIGDQGIAYAQQKFIKDKFPEYNIYLITEKEFNDFKLYLKGIVRKKDIICTIGGGNLGNEYLHHENTRRDIISMFPNNKIIMFPQTIHFSNDELGKKELKKTIEIYNNHKDLTIIAREKISYKQMKEIFNSNVLLTPDIVLYLNEQYEDIRREGAVLCFRNDDEAVISYKEKEYISKVVKDKFNLVTNTDMRAGKRIEVEEREVIVKEKLDQFRKAEIVITDRLHGMIFAAITGTPCIVFSNYNHKIIGTYEWLKEFNYIKFLSQFSDIEGAIHELKSKNHINYNNSSIMKYYDLIIDAINK